MKGINLSEWIYRCSFDVISNCKIMYLGICKHLLLMGFRQVINSTFDPLLHFYSQIVPSEIIFFDHDGNKF